MPIVHTETFNFEDVDYEIRVVRQEEDYIVRAYKGGGKANGYEYM